MPNGREKLYKNLKEYKTVEGQTMDLIPKYQSFEDFNSAMNDRSYRQKLHGYLSANELLPKEAESFVQFEKDIVGEISKPTKEKTSPEQYAFSEPKTNQPKQKYTGSPLTEKEAARRDVFGMAAKPTEELASEKPTEPQSYQGPLTQKGVKQKALEELVTPDTTQYLSAYEDLHGTSLDELQKKKRQYQTALEKGQYSTAGEGFDMSGSGLPKKSDLERKIKEIDEYSISMTNPDNYRVIDGDTYISGAMQRGENANIAYEGTRVKLEKNLNALKNGAYQLNAEISGRLGIPADQDLVSMFNMISEAEVSDQGVDPKYLELKNRMIQDPKFERLVKIKEKLEEQKAIYDSDFKIEKNISDAYNTAREAKDALDKAGKYGKGDMAGDMFVNTMSKLGDGLRILGNSVQDAMSDMTGYMIPYGQDAKIFNSLMASGQTEAAMRFKSELYQEQKVRDAFNKKEFQLPSAYTQSIFEKTANVNGINLIIDENGEVSGARDKNNYLLPGDNKDVQKAVQDYNKSPNKYNPSVFNNLSGKGKSVTATTFQIIMDMVPILASSAVSGGSTLGVAIGSASTIFPSIYKEAVESGEFESALGATLYATGMASAMAFVEAKVGKLEAKFGKALNKEGYVSDFAELAKRMGRGELTPEQFSREGIKSFWKRAGEEVPSEILEELSSETLNQTGNIAVDLQETYNPEAFAEAIIYTPLATLPIGSLTAALNGNAFRKDLQAAAKEPNKFFKTVDKLVANGDITQQQGNETKQFFNEIKSREDEYKANGADEKTLPIFRNLLLDLEIEKKRLGQSKTELSKKRTQARIDELTKKVEDLEGKLDRSESAGEEFSEWSEDEFRVEMDPAATSEGVSSAPAVTSEEVPATEPAVEGGTGGASDGIPQTEAKVESPKVSELFGQTVRYKGKKGILSVDDGGKITIDTGSTVYELDATDSDNISDLGIKPVTALEVKIVDNGTAEVNGVSYNIVTDEKGNVVELTSESGKPIKDTESLIEVEIKRNQTVDNPIVLDKINTSHEEVSSAVRTVSNQDFTPIDNVLTLNINETVDSAIDKLYNGEQLTDQERLQVEIYTEDAVERLEQLSKDYPNLSDNIERVKNGLYAIDDLLTQQKNKNVGEENKRKVGGKTPLQQSKPRGEAKSSGAVKPAEEVVSESENLQKVAETDTNRKKSNLAPNQAVTKDGVVYTKQSNGNWISETGKKAIAPNLVNFLDLQLSNKGAAKAEPAKVETKITETAEVAPESVPKKKEKEQPSEVKIFQQGYTYKKGSKGKWVNEKTNRQVTNRGVTFVLNEKAKLQEEASQYKKPEGQEAPKDGDYVFSESKSAGLVPYVFKNGRWNFVNDSGELQSQSETKSRALTEEWRGVEAASISTQSGIKESVVVESVPEGVQKKEGSGTVPADSKNPALSSVEATAKALEGVAKKKKTAATETGTKVVGEEIVEDTVVNSETLGISKKISEGFSKAGEQSKTDKSPKALGEWLINNAQTGDKIIVDEDTYWVVKRKTDKKGNTEIELQQYFRNENDVFENNPSAVKLFNSKHLGTENAKLAVINASDLFESSYRDNDGNVVVQQSKYIPSSKDSKSISEAYHKAKADGSNPELVKAVEELLGGKEQVQPKKNVRTVSFNIENEGKLKLIRNTPAFKSIFSEAQLKELKVGDNVVQLNMTAWGNAERMLDAKDITNVEPQTKKDDKENKKLVSGKEQVGEEPVEVRPVEEGGGKETESGGVLQAQEEVKKEEKTKKDKEKELGDVISDIQFSTDGAPTISDVDTAEDFGVPVNSGYSSVLSDAIKNFKSAGQNGKARAIVALRQLMPTLKKAGIKVVVHNSSRSMLAAQKKRTETENQATKGFFDPATKELHLNLEKMTDDTPVHEFLHPVISALAKANPTALKNLVDQVKADKDLGAMIDKFVEENYDGETGVKEEEKIVTFLGLKVAEILNQMNLGDKTNESLLKKIVNLLRDFLQNLGLPLNTWKILGDINDRTPIIDLAESIANAIASGKRIVFTEPEKGNSLFNRIISKIEDRIIFSKDFKIKTDKDGRIVSKRLRPEEEQGRNASGEINAEATTILERLHEAVKGKYGDGSTESIKGDDIRFSKEEIEVRIKDYTDKVLTRFESLDKMDGTLETAEAMANVIISSIESSAGVTLNKSQRDYIRAKSKERNGYVPPVFKEAAENAQFKYEKTNQAVVREIAGKFGRKVDSNFESSPWATKVSRAIELMSHLNFQSILENYNKTKALSEDEYFALVVAFHTETEALSRIDHEIETKGSNNSLSAQKEAHLENVYNLANAIYSNRSASASILGSGSVYLFLLKNQSPDQIFNELNNLSNKTLQDNKNLEAVKKEIERLAEVTNQLREEIKNRDAIILDQVEKIKMASAKKTADEIKLTAKKVARTKADLVAIAKKGAKSGLLKSVEGEPKKQPTDKEKAIERTKFLINAIRVAIKDISDTGNFQDMAKVVNKLIDEVNAEAGTDIKNTNAKEIVDALAFKDSSSVKAAKDNASNKLQNMRKLAKKIDELNKMMEGVKDPTSKYVPKQSDIYGLVNRIKREVRKNSTNPQVISELETLMNQVNSLYEDYLKAPLDKTNIDKAINLLRKYNPERKKKTIGEKNTELDKEFEKLESAVKALDKQYKEKNAEGKDVSPEDVLAKLAEYGVGVKNLKNEFDQKTRVRIRKVKEKKMRLIRLAKAAEREKSLSTVSTVLDVLKDMLVNFVRTLVVTGDMSAPLTKGLFIGSKLLMQGKGSVIADAYKMALNAAADGFRGSEKTAIDFYNNLQEAGGDVYEYEYKLKLDHPFEAELTDEYYQSNIATWLGKKLSVANLNFFQASEAHMVTYINHLRFAAFDNFIKNNPNSTTEERIAYAEFINNISGTTVKINTQKYGTIFNSIFLAFKYMSSRFFTLREAINPSTYYKAANGDKLSIQKLKDLAGIVATIAASMGLIAAAFGDDAYVDLDPYSSEFLKLIVGDTSIDFTAGVGSMIRTVFGTLAMIHMSKWPKDFSDIERSKFEVIKNKYGAIGVAAAPGLKFLSEKLNPSFSAINSIVTRKSFIGEPYLPTEMQTVPYITVVGKQLVPIFVKNLWDIWVDSKDSPSLMERLTQTALALHGGSSANFQNQIAEARVKRLLKETDVVVNKKLRLPKGSELNAHDYFKWMWKDEVKNAIGTELMLKLTKGAKLKKVDVEDIIEKYKVDGEKGGEIVSNVIKRLKAIDKDGYNEVVKKWMAEEKDKKEKGD